MEINGIQTDTEGLVALLQFLASNRNKRESEEVETPLVYKIENLQATIVSNNSTQPFLYTIDINGTDYRAEVFSNGLSDLLRDISR